ncbi:MAG: tetratricopeptide repeat protein [Gemmatimonadetes bacterium]|nr:tetratricopeptide repeat protein [Gemmatimonadota bacterium]
MSGLSHRRAAFVAGVVACLVFANASCNGWAVDDIPVVRDNPAAHSIGAALDAAFSPYWPAKLDGFSGGLYRPAAVVSYAVDWTVSGGRPWWFHVVNVLLHGLVTALVVVVAGAWLLPVGALGAGLLFAIHPVHVEAVANVVGRAEILAALGLLTAVLTARRYRRAAHRGTARLWFLATMAAVAFALLSKESAVVAVVFLALDHLLDEEPSHRPMAELYIAVVGLTVGWLFLWHAVAGAFVTTTVAFNFHGLSAGGRIATMLPVQLDVVRLLTWPLQLSHDYSPQVVPQRTAFGVLALLGLMTSGAVLVLGAACVRRAPAIAFGILAAVAIYAPTSNLVFGGGIALAERNLYLAVLAPALVAGWLTVWSLRLRYRRVMILAAAALAMVYVGRTVTRTPLWRDTQTVVIEGAIQHPESYATRIWVGGLSALAGHSASALAEYLIAVELFDRDPLIAMVSVPLALAMGRHRVAIDEARRAYDLDPDHPAFVGLLIDTYRATGDSDSAGAVARTMIAAAPRSRIHAQIYLNFLEAYGAPAWRVSLAQLRLDWLNLRLQAASRSIDSLPNVMASQVLDQEWCLELETLWPGIRALRPSVADSLAELVESARLPCDLPGDPVDG